MDGADAAGGKEATRGSVVRLLAEAGSRALTFVTSLLLMRGLGVDDFGDFAFLAALAVVAAELFDLGLHGTAQRALVAGDLSLRSMLRAKALLLAVAGALSLLLLPFAPVFGLLLLFFGASGWAEFVGVALRCRGLRGQEALVLWLARGGALVAVVIALERGAGLLGIAFAHALSPLAAIVFAFALLRRAGPPATTGRERPVGDVLRLAWPMAINGGLALLNLRAELVVLWLLRGPGDAGAFAAALRLVEALNAAPSAIAAGAMPALTREALSSGAAVRKRTALFAALLAVPCAAGLWLTAADLIPLLSGPGYEPAIVPMQVLALALPFLFMSHVRVHALLAAGHARVLPRLTALRLVSAAGLALVLSPRFGALGAAAGFLASEVLLLALAGRSGRASGFAVAITRPLLAGLVATAPMALCVAALPAGQALAAAAAGAAVYAVTLKLGWSRLAALAAGRSA
ncbi:MAG: oligosaccharide flippase family protein [Vicinamibacteria bacterium]|nr:oligosaccharide flippase family protein [Vicinamibacteria bacterium]